MAERAGFEPAVQVAPDNCLAGSPVQPLQHLSGREGYCTHRPSDCKESDLLDGSPASVSASASESASESVPVSVSVAGTVAVAVPGSEAVTGSEENTPHRDVPGTQLCRYGQPARGAFRTITLPGTPREAPSGTALPAQMEAAGASAAWSQPLRLSFERLRRGCDAGPPAASAAADQKAGAEHRRTRHARCGAFYWCPAMTFDHSRVESRPERSRFGGMAEWSKALVLKTSEVQASVGSNPTPSASNSSDELRWRVVRANRNHLSGSWRCRTDRRRSRGRSQPREPWRHTGRAGHGIVLRRRPGDATRPAQCRCRAPSGSAMKSSAQNQ